MKDGVKSVQNQASHRELLQREEKNSKFMKIILRYPLSWTAGEILWDYGADIHFLGRHSPSGALKTTGGLETISHATIAIAIINTGINFMNKYWDKFHDGMDRTFNWGIYPERWLDKGRQQYWDEFQDDMDRTLKRGEYKERASNTHRRPPSAPAAEQKLPDRSILIPEIFQNLDLSNEFFKTARKLLRDPNTADLAELGYSPEMSVRPFKRGGTLSETFSDAGWYDPVWRYKIRWFYDRIRPQVVDAIATEIHHSFLNGQDQFLPFPDTKNFYVGHPIVHPHTPLFTGTQIFIQQIAESLGKKDCDTTLPTNLANYLTNMVNYLERHVRLLEQGHIAVDLDKTIEHSSRNVERIYNGAVLIAATFGLSPKLKPITEESPKKYIERIRQTLGLKAPTEPRENGNISVPKTQPRAP